MSAMLDSFMYLPPAVKAGVFFVIGACLGSFMNVVFYRIPRKLEWVRTPSSCPSCGHGLNALDLVPILSWLALRGRCRYCHTSISAKYPLIEAAFGVAFASLAYWLLR